MTDLSSKLALISTLSPPDAQDLDNEQFRAILRRHKREGLALAFWARTVALVFISAFLFIIVQWPVVLFPQLFLAAFFVVGWLQQRYGRVGRSRVELLLAFVDIVLLTAVVVIPNPLNPDDLPLPLQYHFDSFVYAFVMLAGVTLSLHWRTINLLGFGVPIIWLSAAAAVWFFFQPLPHLTALADQMFGTRTDLNDLFDPNEINWDQRVQEALVYCLVALILGLNGMRGERLLLQFAEAERKRTNLSRYFSPNVTAELARADDALSQSRTIPVAVMFVDIVGFTRFASGVSAAEAMETLRSFFARMERAVFAHHGTLDKYLGDGLMATFGTPVPGPDSAVNALRCGAAMQSAVEEWNRDRAQHGLPPFRIGVGVHFGEVAFGNIGNSRLELAVIGDTVNVASRLESLTRELDATIAVSREVLEQAITVAGPQDPCLAGFHPVGPRKIQGTSKWIEVVAISRTPALPPAGP